MNHIDILGLLGSIFVGISFIPQTIKTLKSEEIKDISYLFMFFNILASTLMSVYGIYYRILPIIISEGAVLINCCIIIYYMLKQEYDCFRNMFIDGFS